MPFIFPPLLLFGLKVAAAGKPCCIEKPLAPNHADSLAIYNAINASKHPYLLPITEEHFRDF